MNKKILKLDYWILITIGIILLLVLIKFMSICNFM